MSNSLLVPLVAHKVPKGRDIREAEQRIKKLTREIERQEFKKQLHKCPACGNPSLMFKEFERKMFIHCRYDKCLTSDWLPVLERRENADYHSEFLARYQKASADARAHMGYDHCLVLKIPNRRFSLAVDIIRTGYERYILNDRKSGQPKIDEKNKVVWLHGSKEDLDSILTDLKKRNFVERILRDSPIRKDFWHYYNGDFYHMSRGEFRKMLASEAYRMWVGKSGGSSGVFKILFERQKDPYIFLFALGSGDKNRWLRLARAHFPS
jgi:hypothetical protein